MRELRSSGQTKVQRTLNRSEAELGEANVPERFVYTAYGTACWHAFLKFLKNHALARSFAPQKA
jgi:hypothetical protein